MIDGIININTSFAKEFGFTKDKFSGYLWGKPNGIIISLIISKRPGKGNVINFINTILNKNLVVEVPNPLSRMRRLLIWMGFKRTYIFNKDFGYIDVWQKFPSSWTKQQIEDYKKQTKHPVSYGLPGIEKEPE